MTLTLLDLVIIGLLIHVLPRTVNFVREVWIVRVKGDEQTKSGLAIEHERHLHEGKLSWARGEISDDRAMALGYINEDTIEVIEGSDSLGDEVPDTKGIGTKFSPLTRILSRSLTRQQLEHVEAIIETTEFITNQLGQIRPIADAILRNEGVITDRKVAQGKLISGIEGIEGATGVLRVQNQMASELIPKLYIEYTDIACDKMMQGIGALNSGVWDWSYFAPILLVDRNWKDFKEQNAPVK